MRSLNSLVLLMYACASFNWELSTSILWKPTLAAASMVCQNPSMLIPRDPGASPARNFCGLLAAAEIVRELATIPAAKMPADFRNDLLSVANVVCMGSPFLPKLTIAALHSMLNHSDATRWARSWLAFFNFTHTCA